jgi:broad specificity phosphatase PhoE
LSTIVLARHGKPAWDHTAPIPGFALGQWVEGRDQAPLDPSSRPPVALERIARSSRVIAASPLRRSLESAHLLAPGVAPEVRPFFQELSLPTAIHSGLRLRPTLWSSLARAAWYCGWSPRVEDFAAARARASTAANTLAALAAVEDSILLVGHGLMNGLIGIRLRRAGWRGPRFRARRLWAFSVYERLAS